MCVSVNYYTIWVNNESVCVLIHVFIYTSELQLLVIYISVYELSLLFTDLYQPWIDQMLINSKISSLQKPENIHTEEAEIYGSPWVSIELFMSLSWDNGIVLSLTVCCIKPLQEALFMSEENEFLFSRNLEWIILSSWKNKVSLSCYLDITT